MLQSAWQLPDDCLMTAWRLPDNFLITAWQLPNQNRLNLPKHDNWQYGSQNLEYFVICNRIRDNKNNWIHTLSIHPMDYNRIWYQLNPSQVFSWYSWKKGNKLVLIPQLYVHCIFPKCVSSIYSCVHITG